MKFMVAFSSPKRSAKTLETAARHALALNAELILLRMIPDPQKVGVVAQLIATDRPEVKANEQINEAVQSLTAQGINARGIVKAGNVATGIMNNAIEEQVDLLFIGTRNIEKRSMPLMEKDPIVHYLVDHCPMPLFLVRHDSAAEQGQESKASA